MKSMTTKLNDAARDSSGIVKNSHLDTANGNPVQVDLLARPKRVDRHQKCSERQGADLDLSHI